MQRIKNTPRSDWQKQVEQQGFYFHHIENTPYWTEDTAYFFEQKQIETIEKATQNLQDMCFDLVTDLIERGNLAQLNLPKNVIELIEYSWERDDYPLYGRMDLQYDGVNAPKLLEYNADTPTALIEASVVQWHWQQAHYPDADQFNLIHELLLSAWQENFNKNNQKNINNIFYFTCFADSLEDLNTTEYLRDICQQAGLITRFIDIRDMGWDGRNFIDKNNLKINHIFKLYPWEWLIAEAFGEHLTINQKQENTHWIEPPWKMILSNKAILPLLWKAHKNHPNLLPAYFEPNQFLFSEIPQGFVQKPWFGREGEHIQIHSKKQHFIQEKKSMFQRARWVYQANAPLPCFDGFYPVIGSWVIAGTAAGMGIREDTQLITQNTSRFVPHFFR